MAIIAVTFGPWDMDSTTIDAKLDHFCRSMSGPPPSASRAIRQAFVNQKVYDFVEEKIRLGRQIQKNAADLAATAAELAALTFANPP